MVFGVPGARIELATYSSSGKRSTKADEAVRLVGSPTALRGGAELVICLGPELNWGPIPLQGSALPTELPTRYHLILVTPSWIIFSR